MGVEFTHLHCHSEYSLLDGLGRVDALLKGARNLGMKSLALTDHGVMYGAIDFYLAAKELGMKPIIGVETYITNGSRFDRKSRSEDKPSHLLLLAKDETGYQNLIKLTSIAHLEGFYYKPRVDFETLARHSQGLIALSGCASAMIPRLLFTGKPEEARRVSGQMIDLFGRDNFYFELQDHDWPELDEVNRQLIDMASEMSVPLVATNDIHYVKKEDARIQDILLCVQTGTTLDDPKRMKMRGDSYYMKSPEEMVALFGHIPESIANTMRIAEQCHLKLDFGRVQLPAFDIPDGFTPNSYLEKLCRDGLPQRFDNVTPEIEDRLRYELSVIKQTGFALYILIVWDIVLFARQKNIPFGPRGSAAGALVCYLLGISNVDPIANRLVFERFLNIERHEMPDIDMDFADDRRDEMIAYVSQKYGRDRVAQIITFGTLGAKAAIRDVGRVMGIPYGDVDRVAKLVPTLPLHMTIKQAMTDQPQLKEMYDSDDSVRQLLESAMGVEGVIRHASTHAAGVVISRDPLTDVCPLQTVAKGEGLMTQYHANALQKVGLLKMDILGLANLTILRRCIEILKEREGIDIDLMKLPPDDIQTFNSLSRGETIGIFQLEGSGMTRYLVELKPTSIADLAAMIALYRPGPMANIPQYIARKHGLEPIEYPHKVLEDTLRDTYGVMTYQDQVLQVLQRAAGYSLGQADIVRKAMSKKVKSLMDKERPKFVEGCLKNGVTEDEANHLWDLLGPFAGYGFNRSHAACYAQVAYQTAYLKANYPAEYMCAVLSSAMGNVDKVTTAFSEAKRLKVTVLGPSINHGFVDFSIETYQADKAIRFGLGAIKNVGEGAVLPLIAEREKNGIFTSLDDFCTRVDTKSLNKRVLESLVKAGAFDEWGKRSQLLQSLDKIVGVAQQAQHALEIGQGSLFDFMPAEDRSVSIRLPEIPEVATPEKLAWEKEHLGVYVSEHPFESVARALERTVTTTCGELDSDRAGQRVTVAGMLRQVREIITKKRDLMVAAVLEDLHGSLEIVVFPRTYEKTKELWREDAILIVNGRLDSRDERLQLIVDSAEPYNPNAEPDEEILEDAGLSTELSRSNLTEIGPRKAHNGSTGSNGTNGISQSAGADQLLDPARATVTTTTTRATEFEGLDAKPRNVYKGGNNSQDLKKIATNGSRETTRRQISITFERSGQNPEDLARFQQLHDLISGYIQTSSSEKEGMGTIVPFNRQRSSPGARAGDSLVIRLVGASYPVVELGFQKAAVKFDQAIIKQIIGLVGQECVQFEQSGEVQAV